MEAFPVTPTVPAAIPERFRLSLNQSLARHWLAHAIAREEGYEPQEWMLSDEQAGKLADLEALCRQNGGRIGPDRADELDTLRALRHIDELRDEQAEGEVPHPLPRVSLAYDARDASDADETAELVSSACEAGLLGTGAHVYFAFSYNFGGESGFWWHCTLDAHGSTVNLTSQYYELDVLAGEHERGLESAMFVLAEAERMGNAVIASLGSFLSELEIVPVDASRRTCSCGTAFADEPGHDDGENSRT
jgi:hypothetical protein